MGVIALVVGELTALLRVDKSNWSRDLNQAEADLNKLARDADRQSTATATRAEQLVGDVSKSMGKVGYLAPQQGRDAGIKLVDGLDAGLQGAGEKAEKQGQAAGGRFGDEFSKRVGAAFNSLPDATVKVDDVVAQVRIAALRQALESLADKRIGVDLSTNDAVAEVQRIRAELASLSDETVDVQVKADTRAAIAELDRFFGSAGVQASAAGDDAGGKLAQGMNQAIIRNSPLIVAAVGAALAVGAPAMIAGATTLFAGIGIVAAAQSDVVKEAWSGTWDEIKLGTQSAASSLVPVVANMAAKVEESFGRMRPAIQQAFEASGPIIDRFSDSILRAAENALPGLVTAVQSSGPVMEGLGVFLERTGTGLSEFFTIISAHAPAAGAAFAALGDIVGELLPILGELLGSGAELAAVVLPPLASALGVVADVLGDLGPVLPAVVAGFTALKVVNSITEGVGNLATRFAALPGAMSATSAAAAGVAVFIAAVVTEMQHAEQNADKMARAMIQGGDAARNSFDTAKTSMLGFDSPLVDGISHVMDYVGKVPIVGQVSKAAFDLISTTSEEAGDKAEEAFNRMLDAMTPLQRAQADVAHWQNEIARATGDASYVIEDMHGNVTTLAGAEDALVQAQLAAAAAAEQQADALGGTVTTLEEAVEAADNLKNALDSLNGGQLSLNEANREWQESLADVRERIDGARQGLEGYAMGLDITTEAGRQNSAALDEMAQAGNDAAMALYEQTGSYAQFRASLEASRETLVQTAMGFGLTREQAEFYAASVMDIPTQQNLDITTNANEAAREVQGVETALRGVPTGHQINVGVISDNAKSILADLGYTVTTLPNGEVVVTANDQATPILDSVHGDALGLDGVTAGPTLDADRAPFDSIIGAAQAVAEDFGGEVYTPTVDMDPAPFNGVIGAAIRAAGEFAGQTFAPTADMNPAPFNGVVAGALAAAQNLANQRPTPTADMNPGPFNGVVAAALGAAQNLANQRPTPVASLTDLVSAAARAATGVAQVLGSQRPTPYASLIDGVSGPARAAAAAVNSIPNRTVYVSVVTSGVSAAQNIVNAIGGAATGGPVDAFMAAAQRRDGGGPVSGPGGPTDDLVPALLGRTPFRLSNHEWVIRAAAATKYGDAKMAAVNAGVAQIVLPSERPRVRGLAGGGSVSELGGSPSNGGNTISITLNSYGVDFSKQQDRRRIVGQIRDGIVELERASA